MYGNIFTQNGHLVQGLVPDSRAMNASSDVINLAHQHNLTFLLIKGAGATGTATITVEACDDVTPSNTTAIPFKYRRNVGGTDTWGALTDALAAGFVTTANANDMYEISVDPAEVIRATVNGTIENHYVRMTMTQVVADAVDCTILVILPRQGYPQDVPLTVLV